jgi:hypothetical protein
VDVGDGRDPTAQGARENGRGRLYATLRLPPPDTLVADEPSPKFDTYAPVGSRMAPSWDPSFWPARVCRMGLTMRVGASGVAEERGFVASGLKK